MHSQATLSKNEGKFTAEYRIDPSEEGLMGTYDETIIIGKNLYKDTVDLFIRKLKSVTQDKHTFSMSSMFRALCSNHVATNPCLKKIST